MNPELVLGIFYSVCSDFNKISDYKPNNMEKINNFAFAIGRLAEQTDIQKLGSDAKSSNAFDDLVSKLIELIDNKELSMDFRRTCVQEYCVM